MNRTVDKTQEKVNKKTPNGGDYSIAYYKDVDGNPTEKSKAVSVEIVEYKGEDAVFRTYSNLA